MTTVGQVTYIAEIDTAKLANDARTVERTIANTGNNIEASGRRSFSAFSQNASNAFNGVADSIAGLAKIAAGVFVTGAFGAGVFIKQASELQSLKASFESMTGSAENANAVLKQLNKFSFETAFSTLDINKAAQLLLGAGVEVNNLGKYMKQIGDIAGATGADLGALTLPLSQALARGKLQTQDFYQILNSGAGTFRKVLEEEVVKRGLGNLQDALAAGTITTEVLTAALEDSNKKGGFAFDGAIKQSKTFAGQMSNLQETVGNVALKILGVNKATGEVDKNGIFAKLSKAVQDATEWLNKNQDSIIKVANVIIDNAVPAISALAAAFVVAKTAAIGFSIAASINPFGLIAAAIAAVVAGIVFLEVKFGVVSKAFSALKDALKPTIDWFMQNVWPILQQIGNYVGGALKDAWDALKKAFDDVSDALQPLGINANDLGKAFLLLLIPLGLLVGAIVFVIVTVAKYVEGIAKAISAAKDFSDSINKALVDIINTVNQFISPFVSSGQRLIDGFTHGIQEGFKNAIKAAQEGMKAISRFFPHSPAKEGPFSGRGYTTFSGEALTRDLAKGMMSNISLLQDTSNRVASAASIPYGTNNLPGLDISTMNTGQSTPAGVIQNVYPKTDLDLQAASRELAYNISKG